MQWMKPLWLTNTYGNYLHASVIFYALVVVYWAFFHFFKKKSLMNTIYTCIRVSKGSYPDQDRRPVGPDLGPNIFQRPSADDKISLHAG